eukprot:318779_1
MFKQLGSCDVGKCQIIQRNFRNRQQNGNTITAQMIYGIKDNNEHTLIDIATYQIFDKIHCFYQHGYEIGNQVSTFDRYLLQKQITTLQEILQRNSQDIEKSKDLMNKIIKRYTRYNQFHSTTHADSKQKESITDPFYHFGTEFTYGYKSEQRLTVGSKGTPVSAKYSSLKSEMTMNKLSIMITQQFNIEHSKAQIHFNSHYRKKKYANLKFDCVLSLMIYCNYDQLQYEFSKTFRDNINDHNSFYHLGKNLKISLHEFGT